MIIAINTRFMLSTLLEGFGYFEYECFKRITTAHPEHQFIFIFDRPFDKRFIFSDNIQAVVTGPPARHPLLWKFWYDYKIPGILKKYKADVFVSADAMCSLRTRIPQCLVVHDLAFLHYPGHFRKAHLFFYKRWTRKFLLKAKSIATVSEFSKQDIIKQYNIDQNKIDVVYSATKKTFQPLSFENREAIKKKYTNGKEYFFFIGPIHPRKNPVNLLKAFSFFKQRQKSNIKLMLAGRLAWKYDYFIDKLKRYKYRDDVVMLGYLDEQELADITASAYALVYPSLFEGFGVPVLEGMCCDVPVITSKDTAMEEIAGDAALYCNPHDHKDIADKMMLVYKDEILRDELIAKGKDVVKKYSWDLTANLLWESILKAVK